MPKTTPAFVEFSTPDGLTLPGLLYEPATAKQTVIIDLHGNGTTSVFYNAAANHSIGQVMAEVGVATLYFNNRGAHLIKNLTVRTVGRQTRKPFGTAHEKIKDCLFDIDGAIRFLKKRGYREFILMGSSTGANKIAVYNHYRPKNPIKKYVLLSAGDDVGIYYHLFGKTKFWKLLTLANRRIKKKQGDTLMPELYPKLIFSNAAFFDIANPDGDYNVFPFLEALRNIRLSRKSLFRYYRSIKKPTLVIFGEKDEYAWGAVHRIVDLLKKEQPEFTYKIITNADHGLKGHEKELAQYIKRWLTK